ncbi:hypothetical protein ONZ45_g15758 [Pleurotus djamor]|nr:hypothetical protein ONZ45_g15758 [Pleurotus djamor]
MADSPKYCVSLVGTYPDEFTNALSATADFEVQPCDSVVHFKASKRHSAVLALSGSEHVLSEADVDNLLHSGTSLALFKPEHALLETIHKATQTPIDIPSLKLSDDLPLSIYVAGGVVHVAPNNELGEIEVEDIVSVMEESSESDVNVGDGDTQPTKRCFKVELSAREKTEEAVAAISRAVATSRVTPAFASNLNPPIGVIGFKRGTLDNSVNLSITWLAWRADGQFGATTSDTRLIQRYEFTWFTDYYAYATRADPRGKSAAEFDREGGIVYTITINRGVTRRAPNSPPRFLGPTSGFCGYYFIDFNRIGLRADAFRPGFLLRNTAHQPRGLQSSIGLRNNYSINLQQDMQMLENNGNTPTTFPVRYQNNFTLDRFQQNARAHATGVDFDVNYKDFYVFMNRSTGMAGDTGLYGFALTVQEYLPEDNIPINNLTVWSSGVGFFGLTITYTFAFRAFKSSAWRTTSDSANHTHMQRSAFNWSNGVGGTHGLDLTCVVVGHGYVAFVTVGSTTYKQNAPRAQATPAATRQVNDVGPVKGASNPDLGCGLAQNPSTQLAQQTIHVNPGDKMAFDWRGGDLSHWPHNTGPMMTYMADCGREGCEKFDSTKAKWFKIQQVGRKRSGNMDWAQQDLMNGGTAVVTVPNIALGNYLMRHEIIALHLAVSQGGAEFYPSCTQIVVGGNETGRAQTNELVSFPGAYRDNDPGLFDPEVYDPTAPYTFPGPPIVAHLGLGRNHTTLSLAQHLSPMALAEVFHDYDTTQMHFFAH